MDGNKLRVVILLFTIFLFTWIGYSIYIFFYVITSGLFHFVSFRFFFENLSPVLISSLNHRNRTVNEMRRDKLKKSTEPKWKPKNVHRGLESRNTFHKKKSDQILQHILSLCECMNIFIFSQWNNAMAWHTYRK